MIIFSYIYLGEIIYMGEVIKMSSLSSVMNPLADLRPLIERSFIRVRKNRNIMLIFSHMYSGELINTHTHTQEA